MQTRNGNMLHLVIERLAELADGEPTAPERQHLAECQMCRAELAAYQRLVGLGADERRRIAPPLTSWRTLRERLSVEGLMIKVPEEPVIRPLSVRLFARARGAAAAVALLVGGTIVGRLTAGLPLREALALSEARFGAFNDSLALGDAGLRGDEFTSTAAALVALQEAQRQYDRAAQFLAVHDTSTTEATSEQYRERLAVLDRMAAITLPALQQRPQDPIMNQVYVTTLGARELTLSKLGTALPVGARLTRY